MDFESAFFITVTMLILMLYLFLAVAVFIGIPALCVAAFVTCLGLLFVSKKKKTKILWGVLSALSGITASAVISLLIYFIVYLATTPITFM